MNWTQAKTKHNLYVTCYYSKHSMIANHQSSNTYLNKKLNTIANPSFFLFCAWRWLSISDSLRRYGGPPFAATKLGQVLCVSATANLADLALTARSNLVSSQTDKRTLSSSILPLTESPRNALVYR